MLRKQFFEKLHKGNSPKTGRSSFVYNFRIIIQSFPNPGIRSRRYYSTYRWRNLGNFGGKITLKRIMIFDPAATETAPEIGIGRAQITSTPLRAAGSRPY